MKRFEIQVLVATLKNSISWLNSTLKPINLIFFQVQISECIMYLYKAATLYESTYKSKICDILRSVNLALGPLLTSKPKDENFHFNLQAKFSLVICCNNEVPIYNFTNSDTFCGILTNLCALVDSQFKTGFSHEIRDMNSKSPFSCPCVRNLFLFILDKMTSKVFWDYFSRLFLDSTTNSGSYVLPWG